LALESGTFQHDLPIKHGNFPEQTMKNYRRVDISEPEPKPAPKSSTVTSHAEFGTDTFVLATIRDAEG
jgi:hypothetical protein